MNKSFGWYRVLFVLMAILYIFTGIVFLANPVDAALSTGLFVGILMIVYGVMMVVNYFMAVHFKTIWSVILGVLMIVLGLVISTNLFTSANVLGLIVGVGFLCAGAYRSWESFKLKDVGIKSWWLLLILGLLTAACGLIMVCQPSLSGYYLGIYVGAMFLCNGVSDLCLALFGM